MLPKVIRNLVKKFSTNSNSKKISKFRSYKQMSINNFPLNNYVSYDKELADITKLSKILYMYMTQINNNNFNNMLYCQNNISLLIRNYLYGLFQQLLQDCILSETNQISYPKTIPLKTSVWNKSKYFSDRYLNFIMSIINPYYRCLIQNLDDILVNNKSLSYNEKASKILEVIKKTYRYLIIQIRGLDVPCSLIKYPKALSNTCFKSSIITKCESHAHNVIFMFLNKQLIENDEAVDEIISGFKLIKSNTAMLILNFEYLENEFDSSHKLKVENYPNLIKMIENSKYVFADTYIYQDVVSYQNYDIDFGSYTDKFKNKIIYNPDDWKILSLHWKYFGKNIGCPNIDCPQESNKIQNQEYVYNNFKQVEVPN